MSMQMIVSVSSFALSVLFLLASFVLLSKSELIVRKYIRISTVLFITGTLLILVITILRPSVPMTFVWLSEVFVFLIYAASSSMIIYFVKKFAAGASPTANQNSDSIIQNPENTNKKAENTENTNQ